MGLTHKVFGLRSCNEVITGNRHRPCLEFDIKRCLAPCVAAICSAERYAVAVADTIRDSAREAVRALHRLGIQTVMLTGDNRRTAEAVARQLGMDQVIAAVLPEDKARKVAEL